MYFFTMCSSSTCLGRGILAYSLRCFRLWNVVLWGAAFFERCSPLLILSCSFYSRHTYFATLNEECYRKISIWLCNVNSHDQRPRQGDIDYWRFLDTRMVTVKSERSVRFPFEYRMRKEEHRADIGRELVLEKSRYWTWSGFWKYIWRAPF